MLVRDNHITQSDIKSSNRLAPVLIPTLCRYNHLQRCLESLANCIGASNTDVYIALDYPLKQEHIEDWQKISEWLDSIKDTHGFKSLTVYKREENLGVGMKGNLNTLIEEAFKEYDRIIVSEDDNVFSPAFLLYINKGLDRFEFDDSVFAINGYRHDYDIKFSDNTFYRQNVDFSAWGYGIWKNRYVELQRAKSTKYWRKKALNPMNLLRIAKNGANRLMQYLSLIHKVHQLVDNEFSVYMGINQKDVIMPRTSMVRNTGWDGSGENCQPDESGYSQSYMTQEIDKSLTFEYIGSGNEFYRKNHKAHVNESYGRISFMQCISLMVRRIWKLK